MWHFLAWGLTKLKLAKDILWLFGMKALETVAYPLLLTKAITEIQ